MDGLVLDNQRRDLRIPFSSNVRFSTDQFNWHLGRAQNVSKSGIFIATEKMLKIGSKIYLNFSLKTNFQNIKAIGEVVRMAIAEEKAIGQGGSGMGIRFSLLPSEELMVHSVIRGVDNNSVPVRSSSLQQTANNKLYKEEAVNPLTALLKWWLKEIVTKTFSSNYLIVELVLLVVIILVFVAFL